MGKPGGRMRCFDADEGRGGWNPCMASCEFVFEFDEGGEVEGIAGDRVSNWREDGQDVGARNERPRQKAIELKGFKRDLVLGVMSLQLPIIVSFDEEADIYSVTSVWCYGIYIAMGP